MSEDNDSASGRQVISRAAAVLRALAEDNSGQSLGQIAKKTDLRAPPCTASSRRWKRSSWPPPRPPASAWARRWCGWRPRRIPTWSPPRAPSRWGGGCAKPWTCACSGASTRCRSTSSPRTRNCAWSRRWAPPIRSTAPRMAGPAGAPGRRGAGGAAGRAAGTPHRQHHHRAQAIRWRSWPRSDPGWALDLEEHAVGICGIGVHIETGQSEQYALSVALPAAREGQLDACLAALFQCKAEIESLLAG